MERNGEVADPALRRCVFAVFSCICPHNTSLFKFPCLCIHPLHSSGLRGAFTIMSYLLFSRLTPTRLPCNPKSYFYFIFLYSSLSQSYINVLFNCFGSKLNYFKKSLLAK